MTTNSVLWVDGSPAAEAPASPQPVLADRPSGAYTTAYVADGTHIVDWPRHLERLYW
jgi:branched-subunit amino acid aminotransferase/4-amino-4-deoxychorismate lyase